MKTLEEIQRDTIIRIERNLCRSLYEPEVDFVKRYTEMLVNRIDEYVASFLTERLQSDG